MIKRSLALNFVCVCTAVLLSGCGGLRQDASGFDRIVGERVPLMEDGPMQSTPPSSYLEPGTRVRVINPAGNHAYVETVTGKKGFIPTDSIQLQDGR